MQIMEFRKRICEQNKIIKLFINIIITVVNFDFTGSLLVRVGFL